MALLYQVVQSGRMRSNYRRLRHFLSGLPMSNRRPFGVDFVQRPQAARASMLRRDKLSPLTIPGMRERLADVRRIAGIV